MVQIQAGPDAVDCSFGALAIFRDFALLCFGRFYHSIAGFLSVRTVVTPAFADLFDFGYGFFSGRNSIFLRIDHLFDRAGCFVNYPPDKLFFNDGHQSHLLFGLNQ